MEKNRELYLGKNKIKALYKILTRHPDVIFLNAIEIFNKYKKCKENKNVFGIFYYGMKANRIASKYNLELYGKIGENVRIWHNNIVINNNAIIGDNVQFHGSNCVGEKGNGKAPKIGNNVDIGFGSVLIGDIEIADNIIVGANSVVNKSFLEERVVIAGCPAKIIKRI